MAFIEKAGDILSQVLKKTLEDPDKVGRGLELLVRGATLPDPDDSTGDFRATGRALGRFRQEERKRDQEDIEKAQKEQARALAQKAQADRVFQTSELDRKLTFEAEQAQVADNRAARRAEIAEDREKRQFARTLMNYTKGETRADQRHAESMARFKSQNEARTKSDNLKTKNDAKKAIVKWLSDDSLFGLMGQKNKNGVLSLNDFGKKLYKDSEINYAPPQLRKLLKAKSQTSIAAKNKTDNETQVNIGEGTILAAYNSVLPEDQQENLNRNKKFMAPVSATFSKTEALTESFNVDILRNFEMLTGKVFTQEPTQEMASNLGLTLDQFKKRSDEYKKAIAFAENNGPSAPNKGLDNFVKNSLVPFMRQHGSVPLIKKAFEKRLKGVTHAGSDIELGSLPVGNYKITTTDINFLKTSPVLSRVALELGILKQEDLQQVFGSIPDGSARTEITPKDSSPEKTSMVMTHNPNHWPIAVAESLVQMVNNANKIEDQNDKKRFFAVLESGRKTYSTMSVQERNFYVDTLTGILEKNKSDFLPPNTAVNRYVALVNLEVGSTATNIKQRKGGVIINANLQKDGGISRQKLNSKGKPTGEMNPIFVKRGRMQSQRLEIATQLIGLQEIVDLKDEDMTTLLDAQKAYESLPTTGGAAAELALTLENAVKSLKEFGINIGGFTSSSNTFRSLKNNSLYGKAKLRPSKFREQFGYSLDLRGDNEALVENLAKTAEEQSVQLKNAFKKSFEKSTTEQGKRAAHALYLKRATMLWEKTALTYKLAGYVQGDQTGGRTISNQDFENVYKALWGGGFNTEAGTRNAIKYLTFKNNEALRRGVAEDLLLEAKGQLFGSTDRFIELVKKANKDALDVYYGNNPEVKEYMDKAEASGTPSQTRLAVDSIENLPAGGLKEYASQIEPEELRKDIKTSQNIAPILINYLGKVKEDIMYEPNKSEMMAYGIFRNTFFPTGMYSTDFGNFQRAFVESTVLDTEQTWRNNAVEVPKVFNNLTQIYREFQPLLEMLNKDQDASLDEQPIGFNHLEKALREYVSNIDKDS